MKQIIQNMKTGETKLEDIPSPQAGSGQVLIKTTRSLVSLGTERMLVEFGKASLISKARQQPDKVKMVMEKVKADGLMPTLETVFKKLEQPLPLGYCNVGKVVEVGNGVKGFKVGDRVVSNGRHAEYVAIPQNLVAHIPDGVSDEEASFTVIASIGLQGIRLANPTFGETVVVTGLGLIGLITAQLLQANGCNVIGIDLDEAKLKLARERGITTVNPRDGIDVVKFVNGQTNNVGADAVIITASAKTNDIISQAANMSRKRGRIVLVGVIGLNISRADFYEKELSFQVSCSYGPGRYDEFYEQKGHDYPLPYVRWTEKRNFQAILQAMKNKTIVVKPMITEIIPLEQFDRIYGDIGDSKSIASIISYPEKSTYSPTVSVNSNSFNAGSGVFGIVGAGNFTKMSLLPAMKGAAIKYIASKGGVNGTALAKKYGISNSTTDYRSILQDPDVNTVVITTRHDLHADMVINCLKAGKNVFVEKPLAITRQELDTIIETYIEKRSMLTVGFNRRFSPHIQKIKKQLDPSAGKNFIATMNAGHIPSDVWVHDMQVGGGRIIGEACHYIDLITFLSGSKVKEVCMNAMGIHPEENTDNASIMLKYENGDHGVINYFANGNKAYSKERLEVYSQGNTIIMDNFRTTYGYGTSGLKSLKTKLDKGHKNQFQMLIDRAKNGGEALIPFDEIVNTTKASFAAIQSLKSNAWVKVQ